jgi:hypothetical protein
MNKIIYAGCSFTAGTGFDKKNITKDYKESPDLWVNLCSNNIRLFKNLTVINLAKAGASNSDIFEQAIEAISNYSDIKYLVCAWTSSPRNTFDVGFELYTTECTLNTKFIPQKKYTLNNRTLSEKYIQDCINRMLTLIHIQPEIVKILKYINVLKKIAKNIKVININALCPWDYNFFTRLSGKFYPSDLSTFTKTEILNIENRDDEEIYKLYNKQHDQYDAVGGVNSTTWVNLYDSFLNLKKDVNFDKTHPGIESNQLYFNLVKEYIETVY